MVEKLVRFYASGAAFSILYDTSYITEKLISTVKPDEGNDPLVKRKFLSLAIFELFAS